jgi:hypothetical protein
MSDEDARDDATATPAKESAPTVPTTAATTTAATTTAATTTATAAEDDDARLRALVRRARSAARDEGLPEPGAKEAAHGSLDADADAGAPTGEPLEPEDDGHELDDVDLKDALRGALAPPPGSVAPRLLGGVQRRIRLRSRGRFFGDGWSVEESPRTTYLVTSALMLVLLGVLALALLPSSGARLP